MPEPKQSVEDIQRLVQAARAAGAQAPELDPEVELEGMDAEEEGGGMCGSGAHYAV